VGFVAPAFLVGALAVGLPLYLHLLRRNTSTPLPFSSLMFFELRQQSTTRRRRLRYLLLLALRMALVLLMALAFAEPYVRQVAAGGAPDRLLLVVVDNSFSMRAGTRLADARRGALAVLSAKRPGDRAQVLALDAQVHVLTQATQDAPTLRAAVESIEPGDSRGSFGVLATAVRSIAEDERAPIELHLFSDMQRTGMPPSFSEMALPGNVSLVLHPAARAVAPNWVVESVLAPREVWDPHTAHVRAVIAGYETPAATRTVSFVVNGKTIATRRVDVPASGRATAEIDSLELPYGFSRCSVKIDAADSLPADDEFVFAIDRADRKRGLFVFQAADTRSALYFDDALGAATNTAVVLDKVTVDRVSNVDPASYAFVVISDVASLPASFTKKMLDYVHRGGNVLIVLGTVAAQQHEIPFFDGGILSLRHYSRDAERFAAVGQTDSTYPAGGSPEEWEGVKFFYAAVVDERNTRVGVRLQDSTPLLLEKTVGEGRVMVFASGLDNLTNDLPLHPVFVAFVERMARYLSGGEAHGDPHRVDDLIALRNAKEQAIGVEVIDPTGRRSLSLQEAVSSQWYPLTRTGFYEVHLANGRRDLVAVNADRRESDLAPIPADELALWRGSGVPGASVGLLSPPGAVGGVPLAAAGRGAASVAAPQVTALRRGLWWYAMLGVLAAALAESAIGGRYLATLRDEP
jgi:Aerotolerance regulator N-terminal/von Willebrand factor type A domain